MKVTLLGTGGSAGVPMIGGIDGSGDWGDCDPAEPRNRRTRSSIAIETADKQRLLVDTSPDMRSQLLDCRIAGVDAFLFTHAHADHITGIDDVRILNRIAGRPLPAFATAETLEEITRRFGYAFRPWQPPHFYRPVLEANIITPGNTYQIVGQSIRMFTQAHGRVQTVGLRVNQFAYSTDVVELDEDALAALAGVDTWVVGCFLRQGPHWTHADLNTVVGWVERLRPRRTILTHMGTDMDWAWMQANLPPGIEPGYDGMVLTVSQASSMASSQET
jgi:phosphoribosyl 1,2-cyclic phosphate phosphodiesterase